MNLVVNRALLMRAAQRVATQRQSDLPEFDAIATALAQVITDQTGIRCEVAIRFNAQDAAQAVAQAEREP